MPKKPTAKKSKPARKPDAADFFGLLKEIQSDIRAIADMVANLGPKEPEEDTPDEAA